MAPPTEPRRGETAVSFVDTPGLVRVSGTVEMVDLAYWKFLTLINKLSATVCHKLDRLPRQYAEGRGFVIGDGPWWYRFVKDSVDGNKNEEVGPWTILDNVHAYENMVAQVTLGLKWADARIDVQHNVQKKRDEAEIEKQRLWGNQGQGIDTQSTQTQLFTAAEPSSNIAILSTQNPNTDETTLSGDGGLKAAKTALCGGHGSRITSSELGTAPPADTDKLTADEPVPSIQADLIAEAVQRDSSRPLIVSGYMVRGSYPPPPVNEATPALTTEAPSTAPVSSLTKTGAQVHSRQSQIQEAAEIGRGVSPVPSPPPVPSQSSGQHANPDSPGRNLAERGSPAEETISNKHHDFAGAHEPSLKSHDYQYPYYHREQSQSQVHIQPQNQTFGGQDSYVPFSHQLPFGTTQPSNGSIIMNPYTYSSPQPRQATRGNAASGRGRGQGRFDSNKPRYFSNVDRSSLRKGSYPSSVGGNEAYGGHQWKQQNDKGRYESRTERGGFRGGRGRAARSHGRFDRERRSGQPLSALDPALERNARARANSMSMRTMKFGERVEHNQVGRAGQPSYSHGSGQGDAVGYNVGIGTGLTASVSVDMGHSTYPSATTAADVGTGHLMYPSAVAYGAYGAPYQMTINAARQYLGYPFTAPGNWDGGVSGHARSTYGRYDGQHQASFGGPTYPVAMPVPASARPFLPNAAAPEFFPQLKDQTPYETIARGDAAGQFSIRAEDNDKAGTNDKNDQESAEQHEQLHEQQGEHAAAHSLSISTESPRFYVPTLDAKEQGYVSSSAPATHSEFPGQAILGEIVPNATHSEVAGVAEQNMRHHKRAASDESQGNIAGAYSVIGDARVPKMGEFEKPKGRKDAEFARKVLEQAWSQGKAKEDGDVEMTVSRRTEAENGKEHSDGHFASVASTGQQQPPPNESIHVPNKRKKNKNKTSAAKKKRERERAAKLEESWGPPTASTPGRRHLSTACATTGSKGGEADAADIEVEIGAAAAATIFGDDDGDSDDEDDGDESGDAHN